jgi:hypothetical protein
VQHAALSIKFEDPKIQFVSVVQSLSPPPKPGSNIQRFNSFLLCVQHAALSIKFEEALQAVDPSVTLPYWDYTIDAETIANTYAGNYSAWFLKSEVMMMMMMMMMMMINDDD